MVPETPQSSDNKLPLVPHDDYAIPLIKRAKVHFRLRRTTPTLWRYEATCYTCMRVFAAIDDSVRIAIPGVVWQIGDHVVTVLVVACLGYSHEPSRSAKVVDTRATKIIVRHSSHKAGAIRFGQMTKMHNSSEVFPVMQTARGCRHGPDQQDCSDDCKIYHSRGTQFKAKYFVAQDKAAHQAGCRCCVVAEDAHTQTSGGFFKCELSKKET